MFLDISSDLLVLALQQQRQKSACSTYLVWVQPAKMIFVSYKIVLVLVQRHVGYPQQRFLYHTGLY
jgi:hypothetical protein